LARRRDHTDVADANQPDLTAEIAGLKALITRTAAAAEGALRPPTPESLELPERRELCRQLEALRARVARAGAQLSNPSELRSELATLSFFARTLRQDAEAWRATLHQALTEHRRKEAAERSRQRRLAAEHDRLLQRRDLLQAEINRAAGEVAQYGGECRRTVPVITLAEAVTVASITVSRPRRRLRAGQLWLVTLAADRERILVRQD
jgi:hypothetical protein